MIAPPHYDERPPEAFTGFRVRPGRLLSASKHHHDLYCFPSAARTSSSPNRICPFVRGALSFGYNAVEPPLRCHCVPTCQAFRQALRLLSRSSGVEWLELALINSLSQRT